MKTIIAFEWKKIFEKKLNIIAMLVGYALIVLFAANFIMGASYYDEASSQIVRGVQAIRIIQEQNNSLTDYLTEEYLSGVIAEIQQKNIPLETDEGYLQVIRSPWGDVLRLVAKNFTNINIYSADLSVLNKISNDDGIHFYERRIEKTKEYLNEDHYGGGYSEEEKEFWLSKIEQVKTPFKWGDKNAMGIVWDTIIISFYLIFVIAICITPVFASEYESGAVALLLTTKKGKTKLIYAKILASVLFAFIYMLLGIGLGVFIDGIFIGFDGADLPLQLWETLIGYDWSVGMACLANAGILLLIALTITLLTLLLSSRIKSSLVVLVLDFVLLIIPIFLPQSKTNRLWNHIYSLFPTWTMSLKSVLSSFYSYQFGTVIISYLGMIVLVYSLISLISLFGIKGGFANHQVKT